MRILVTGAAGSAAAVPSGSVPSCASEIEAGSVTRPSFRSQPQGSSTAQEFHVERARTDPSRARPRRPSTELCTGHPQVGIPRLSVSDAMPTADPFHVKRTTRRQSWVR